MLCGTHPTMRQTRRQTGRACCKKNRMVHLIKHRLLGRHKRKQACRVRVPRRWCVYVGYWRRQRHSPRRWHSLHKHRSLHDCSNSGIDLCARTLTVKAWLLQSCMLWQGLSRPSLHTILQPHAADSMTRSILPAPQHGSHRGVEHFGRRSWAGRCLINGTIKYSFFFSRVSFSLRTSP